MKRKLIKMAVIAAIVVALIAMAVTIRSQIAQTKRLKETCDALLRQDNSTQLELTKRELKRYFADEVAKLKEYGIKPGQVENIVNVEYRYIDSVRYRDTLVWVQDTLKNDRCATFDIKTECYSITGEINADTLEIGRFEYNDGILVSLYKERRKCLFEKRKVKAIAISECRGDTLSVLRNLKIQKGAFR